MNHPAKCQQSGLTLVEVLVAILIFSFGLLGFVGLQARAIQYSVSAEDSNRAALLANEMGSTILLSGVITPSPAALSAWQARASDPTGIGLPNGNGTVSVAGGVATITLTWRAAGAASGAANSTNKYVTQVVIP
jgi:type IV pilus assembly protein PilV